jgi:two-component system, NarL family, invasion response regulator UvrY
MKVLIVDDHPIVLAGCKLLMADEPGVRLIGAANARSALELFSKHNPDVVVLDLNLPGDSATALMRQIMERDSKARIVIFTMNDDPMLAAQMLEAGAKGYVSKNEDPTCIVTAIREAAAYRFSISPVLAQKIATLRISPTESVRPKISARERDILGLLASGKSMSEIAASVNLSYKTVSATCKKLRGRFEARTTVELVRIAILLGIC